MAAGAFPGACLEDWAAIARGPVTHTDLQASTPLAPSLTALLKPSTEGLQLVLGKEKCSHQLFKAHYHDCYYCCG